MSGGRIVREAAKLMLSIILFAAIFVLWLYWYQDRMVYFPQRYPQDLPAEPALAITDLHYSLEEGRQRSFFVEDAAGHYQPGAPIWLAFGGNASLALNWLPTISRYPDKRAAFILIDYPGYGGNQGRPSPDAIRQSAEAAFAQAAKLKGLSEDVMRKDLRLIGHSLGAGAALIFGREHPVSRVVLISPFTSLFDMAKRSVGKPLCYLLRRNYDNRANLAVLLARTPPAEVIIFHGSEDDVIPVEMGRELGAIFPAAEYLEVPGGDHNMILDAAADEIAEAMARPLRTAELKR